MSMCMASQISAETQTQNQTWTARAVEFLIKVPSSLVFFLLDLLDIVLCVFYRVVDELLEGEAIPCYCEAKNEEKLHNLDGNDEEGEVSETLFGRKNVFWEMGFLRMSKKLDLEESKKARVAGALVRNNRWSDCGCQSCVSWVNSGDQRLHLVVKGPSQDIVEVNNHKTTQNVVFIHGFLSSSLFWTQTVFENLSEHAKQNYRLFAVDLLGFGESPKPRDCLYTLRDHLDMIDKSAIRPYDLDSFHLVAHSMGCIIALALAARYPESVKSITLIAPPYFPSEDGASLKVLAKVAEKRLWPPILFGASLMSWYEHLGRCVCFLVCRNHRIWEWFFKLLSQKGDLPFNIKDLTRHTHHSAWHTMHNVICGGAKLAGKYLEVTKKAGVRISVVQGDQDVVVPMECSRNIQLKAPDAKISIINGADHGTVVLGREKDFTRYLEGIWASTAHKPTRVRRKGD
ncbi:Alpha/beta hydrolase fold-1 [Dillenia turbinata]|uniref:Alpha/beta hydrolase fold-1 n=1 Tax=Dillenia turbinata TaxID=194707 RepID=A0AAN8ZPN4_9MAGN